ncbi:hypothetical protein BDL97_03G054700 [Sphagnum fallax]|nr:hypothetical protein BDL97_03G054700 [Sphagnum fallax]
MGIASPPATALYVLAERLLHCWAAVGQWAGVEDETTWGVMSSVGMSASVAKANDIKWPPTVKRAAVLLCLFKGSAGELRVILTKRAGTLSSHSGEVALPGGKRDEEDEDDAATALREAQEEIGLEPSQVRVVAVFEPFLSKHLLAVTPVVGLLRENSKFTPTGNPAEVESIFDTPLEMFLKVQGSDLAGYCLSGAFLQL